MNKNGINEPGVPGAADCKLQKNSSENIPVFLILGLCILAVSLFSNQSYVFEENSAAASTDSEKYIWITGSPRVKEGLYLLTPEQLKETFPELLSPGTISSAPQEFDSRVSAIQYKSDVPQLVQLPPAVANIFFQPIPINRANKEILSTLPGIGPMLAERIVLKRNAQGPFRSKNELLNIKGIGPKKFAGFIDSIIID